MGEEETPLDFAKLPKILEVYRQEGVQAIAICLLNSYANPVHEETLGAEIKKIWPEIDVVCSTDITREWREYERSNTAVLSAYVKPIVGTYLRSLNEQTHETLNVKSKNLYIMQSNCGVDLVESICRNPISMVESGPASGVLGAMELGKLIGEPNVIALDIGGTTAKCSLICDGMFFFFIFWKNTCA
jgi:N-methylhydantoinase A